MNSRRDNLPQPLHLPLPLGKLPVAFCHNALQLCDSAVRFGKLGAEVGYCV